MTALPAAHVGSTTQHGMPLNGTGSPNVTINSLPAWTSDIPHVCPIHGAEMVGMGSETVHINSHRAARASDGASVAGDFLQGAGPPDQIFGGSANVLIGNPAIGVATPANETRFCQLYCQLVHDWPGLTPDERQRRYEAMLGTMFGTFGAPAPGTSQGLPAGADASFDRGAWRVNVAANAWANNAGPPSGRATLHEVRHGEQAFLAMRAIGGTGPSDALLSARAAAASQPLDPNTPEGRMGSLHRDNEISQPGYDHWQRVITEVGDAANSPGGTASTRYAAAVTGPDGYYNQPGGADARTVETAGNCSGCP